MRVYVYILKIFLERHRTILQRLGKHYRGTIDRYENARARERCGEKIKYEKKIYKKYKIYYKDIRQEDKRKR